MSDLSTLRHEAEEAYRSGDYTRAAELYREVVARDPDSLDAWGQLGTALYQVGQFAGSVEAFREALRLRPDIAGIWFQLGGALADAGHASEAEEALRRSIDLDGAQVIPRRWLARLLGNQRRWAEAREAWLEVVLLDPRDAEAWYQRGVANALVNSTAEALDCARQARRLDPRIGGAWMLEGACLLDLKRPDEAVGAFDRLIEQFPDFEGAYYRRAMGRVELEQWAGAIEDMRRAAEQEPGLREECQRWIAQAEEKLRPIANAPAPVAIGNAPPPRAIRAAPAPVPVGKAPAPVPVGKAPAPVPVGKAPAPAPVGKAPAPQPVRAAPPTVPVANAPGPARKALTPVPVAAAPSAPVAPAARKAPVADPKATSPYEVPTHGGEPQPDDAVFLAPPPAAIGPLESAATTLRKGMSPGSRAWRITKAAMWAVSAAVIAVVCLVGSDPGRAWLLASAAAAGAIAALVSWNATAFKHRCSYVGRDGLAVCESRGPGEVSHATFLLFDEVTALSSSRTNVFVNGAYAHTRYQYDWTDAGGQVRWSTAGAADTPTPPATHDMHFAMAAERAWTRSYLSRANDELGRAGHLEFPMSRASLVAGSRKLRVGPGWIELLVSGKAFRHEAADVACVRVHEGEVSIRPSHPREPIFGTEDEYVFPAGEIVNLSAFLAVVEQVGGIRVSV
jgi:tetratricopeptide (TPR) repeat protein